MSGSGLSARPVEVDARSIAVKSVRDCKVDKSAEERDYLRRYSTSTSDLVVAAGVAASTYWGTGLAAKRWPGVAKYQTIITFFVSSLAFDSSANKRRENCYINYLALPTPAATAARQAFYSAVPKDNTLRAAVEQVADARKRGDAPSGLQLDVVRTYYHMRVQEQRSRSSERKVEVVEGGDAASEDAFSTFEGHAVDHDDLSASRGPPGSDADSDDFSASRGPPGSNADSDDFSTSRGPPGSDADSDDFSAFRGPPGVDSDSSFGHHGHYDDTTGARHLDFDRDRDRAPYDRDRAPYDRDRAPYDRDRAPYDRDRTPYDSYGRDGPVDSYARDRDDREDADDDDHFYFDSRYNTSSSASGQDFRRDYQFESDSRRSWTHEHEADERGRSSGGSAPDSLAREPSYRQRRRLRRSRAQGSGVEMEE